MPDTAAAALSLPVKELSSFLAVHAPFAAMPADTRQWLAAQLRIRYFAEGQVVLTPQQGKVKTLLLIWRGRVGLSQTAEQPADSGASALNVGECFPLTAITSGEAVSIEYRALTPLFCLTLARAAFVELLARSPEFQRFCSAHLISLLETSRRALQQQFAVHLADGRGMQSPLSEFCRRTPLSVPRHATLRYAIGRMVEASTGSVVVIDDEQRPVGIFTRTDVLRQVAGAGMLLDASLEPLMTPHPTALPGTARAHEAAVAMATHGIRHVVITGSAGELLGVVSERDLFAVQQVGIHHIRSHIDRASDDASLAAAATAIHQLAFNLLAQGFGAEQLTRFISTLNDALGERVLHLMRQRHQVDDLEFCWLAFGSEGRMEQTFSTDQDNGIVFTAPAAEVGAVRERLLAFARDVNRSLDVCGFPLCKGNIMASNPELCLTLEEWQQKFSAWIRSPTPEALLSASIFFDFRALHGALPLAQTLQRHLLDMAPKNTIFLHLLAANALSSRPALGTIQDFVKENEGDCAGGIDIKKSGIRIFVDAARLFALAHGIPATSTAERLRATKGPLKLPEKTIEAILAGFHYLQILRLRHQQSLSSAEQASANRIDPDQLNALDQRVLKESLQQARRLQDRIRSEYRR